MTTAALAVTAIVTKMKLPKITDLPLFLASGFFGFFLYMIVFNKGLSSVPAATASVVNATVPMVTALIAGVVHREKVREFQWAAVVIELVGVVILTAMSGGLTQSGGLVWLFFAALSLSIYNILQRKLTKKYTAMQASTYSIFSGMLMLAIFSPTAFRELSAAPAIQYADVLLLGVFPSAVAYVSWSAALSERRRRQMDSK